MVMTGLRMIIGISLGVMLFAGTASAVEPADVEKYVNARIEIGEMMSNYFKGGGVVWLGATGRRRRR